MYKLFILALTLALSIVLPAHATRLNIVSSIEPISYIINDIAKGSEYHLETLITGNGSPHDFHMKPSTAALVKNADIVFFIDSNFETFIKAPLNNKNYIMLARQQGMIILPIRSSKVWYDDDHHHHHHHEDEITPHSSRFDYHIWLSPKNAINMATAIAAILTERNPSDAKLYRTNLATFISSIELANQEVTKLLSTIKGRPYIVFHDAYQYFEDFYGLNSIGAINLDPAHKPSAKTLKELVLAARNSKAICIFAEPQFPESLLHTVATQANLKVATLNPLSVEDEAPSYPKLFYQLTTQLKTCLD